MDYSQYTRTGSYSKLEVAAPRPNGFAGMPALNSLNATFCVFSDNPLLGEYDI